MAVILLLEDDHALRRIFTVALEEYDHEVIQSDNGIAAYDTELLNSVDLMITDLVMPRVDGLDAIRTALKAKKDLKVVAMSGGSPSFNQDYLEVATIFGAELVFHKPLEPEKLVRIVNTALVA